MRSRLGFQVQNIIQKEILWVPIRPLPQCKVWGNTNLLNNVSDLYNSTSWYDTPMGSLLDFGSLPLQVQHVEVLSLAASGNMIIVAVVSDKSQMLVR